MNLTFWSRRPYFKKTFARRKETFMLFFQWSLSTFVPRLSKRTQKVERKTHTKQQQQQQQQQVKRPLYTPLIASVPLFLGYLQYQCNFLVWKNYKYRLPINYHFDCYNYNYYLHLFIGEPTCGGFLMEVEFSYWISQQTLFYDKAFGVECTI